jgi:two-component system cell cycle response regulator
MLKKVMTMLQSIIHTDNVAVCKTGAILNVLVVDDSFPVRKYMEHTLPKLVSGGLKIEFASSGEEALEKISNGIFGLVFLDVVMPGMDGYKVCKKIKSSHNCHVVMLTSKKSPFDRVRGTMSGCNAYITKPPEDSKLRKVLEKCLAEENPVFLTANGGL